MKRGRFGWGDDGDDLDDIQFEEDRSPSAAPAAAAENAAGDEEEVDPLDAFMEGIHQEVSRIPNAPSSKRKLEEEEEEDDPMETFLKARRDAGLSLAAEALHAGYDSDEEVYAAARAVEKGLIEYDSDDNAIVTADRKKIEPLVPLDHSEIQYEPFGKDFYEEDATIAGMSDEDAASYKQTLGVRTSGFDVPRPVKQFKDLGLDSLLMGAISKQGYQVPTPIQCQALPIVLSGRDIIGIAKTGSGKTAAFVLPMIVHIMDQEELSKGEGPIGVICAPTRELAQQIYNESKKFAKPYGIRVSGVFGGMSKLDQFKELKAGCEIVVATPGRLIDMIKMKALTMLRATYLVLDEADRMFDLGFEPQIRSIVGQIRPDRQTLLFSATMPRRVETLAREILSDPVRVTAGEVGRANEDVTQVAKVVASDAEKLEWMLASLPRMVDDGDVLVFASTKARVEDLEGHLKERCFKVAALHGDKDQASRIEVLQAFKSGVFHVLVASDVAARGLDIKSIKSVVNYDIAKDMNTHVHRVGRTGRAGDKEGVAYTLLSYKESRFAGELVNGLIAAGQNVPSELMELAMKDGRFRAQREGRARGGGKGKGGGRGGGRGGARGKGGGGRGVRGVDYGLGIGYNPEASSKPGHAAARKGGGGGVGAGPAPNSSMARFKSSFVPATSASGGKVLPGFAPASSGKVLPGFTPATSVSSGKVLLGFTPAASASSGKVLPGFTPATSDSSGKVLQGFTPAASASGGATNSRVPGFTPATTNTTTSLSSNDNTRHQPRSAAFTTRMSCLLICLTCPVNLSPVNTKGEGFYNIGCDVHR